MPIRYFCDNCDKELVKVVPIGRRKGQVYLAGKNRGWWLLVSIVVETPETTVSSPQNVYLCQDCIKKAVAGLLK